MRLKTGLIRGASILCVLCLFAAISVAREVTWADFSSTSPSGANQIAAAPDFVAPSASRSVMAPTSAGTPGTVTAGGTYYVYAQVSDTGNPPSGVSTVRADVSSITAGASAAALSSGSFTVGGESYNYRSASLTADSGLSPGSTSYSLTSTDGSNNIRTQSGYSVTVTESLDHFDIDPIAEGHSGKSFSITVRAETASGATLTSFNGTVTLSVNAGLISPTTSSSFVNGVLTQTVTITGSYRTNQTITVTGGSPAEQGTSNAFTLHDWKYYFTKTTANTGTNCATATRLRDMAEGYAGADPEETFSRGSSGQTHLRFCSPTFDAGDSLRVGTTTVQAYVDNTAGSTCAISATLYKRSGGTTTSLGTASHTIPGQTAITLRTWTINTAATSFAAGDRLNLSFNQQEVKACDSTDIHYGGTTYRSNVQFPGP